MGRRARKTREPERAGSLAPSDQLLAIFAVNVILVAWVAYSLVVCYEEIPHLPKWIFWAEGAVLVISGPLSLLDTWWPRLKGIAEDRDGGRELLDVNVNVFKAAVFALTVVDVVVLWRLAESTGGVLSPYAPFLPAPAIFASFVTKKWQTILGLSIGVAIAIGVSTIEVPHEYADLLAYQGSAAVMVILAGLLSALRARVAQTGQSITGQWSALADDRRPPPGKKLSDVDDDDDLPSPANP